MSRPTINDPTGVLAYQTDFANMAVPTDLKALLDQQTAVAGQLANIPSTHPSYAALLARSAVIQAAIAAYKPRDAK